MDESRSKPPVIPPTLVADSEISFLRSLSKLFVTAVVVTVSVWALHKSSLGDVVGNIQAWKDLVAGWGVWGPLGVYGAMAVLIVGGFPRLWLAGACGALFGFRIGFPVAWLASITGAYGNFLFIRWGARDAVERLVHVPLRLRPLLVNPGYLSVFLLRQMPLWGVVQNSALAVSRVRHRVYLLGTLFGILPGTLVAVLIGSGLGKASLQDAVRNLASAMVIMGALGALAWLARARLTARR